jgi:pimeloyl-ACP methyl ester carboxylesterase
MPIERLNGINIYSESHGTIGPPIVLVHGSRGDHHSWDAVVPQLARTGRVTTYDRRGHSQSERPAGQGSIREDVADLAALIEHHHLSPRTSSASLVDEIDDRTASTIDLARLSSFGGPLMMSRGTESPSFFDAILDIIADAVPRAQRYTFRGAGHVPHVTHPDDYAMVIGAYISGVADAAIADR